MTKKTHKGLEITHSLVAGVSFVLVVGSIGILLATSSRSDEPAQPSVPVVQFDETKQQEVAREYAFRVAEASDDELEALQRDISNEIAQTENEELKSDLQDLEVEICLRLGDTQCVESRLSDYEQGSPERNSLTEELAQLYIADGNAERATELIQSLIDQLDAASGTEEIRAYYEAQLEALR